MHYLKEKLDIFIEKVNTSDEIKRSIRNSKLEIMLKIIYIPHAKI